MNKILSKYGALFVCILFLATLALYYKYSCVKARLIPDTQKYLESILNERSQEIYTYLNQQEDLIQTLARDQKMINMLTGNTKNIPKDTLEAATKLYNELPTIKNILFIQHNGDIIAAIEEKEKFKDKNILQAPWDTSELSESFMRSSMTLTIDISGFEFNSLIKRPALFMSAPIIVDDTFYGCIVLELYVEPIYLMLRKYLGLKTTGEVTIGRLENGKIMYVAPTRHSPNMLFKSLENRNDHLEDAKSSIGYSMWRAIFSEKGSGEAIDYRGHNVIAAWSYLTRIDWGIVAKIDLVEVLATGYRWYISFLFFFLMTVISCIIGCILIRKRLVQWLHIPTLSPAKVFQGFLWIGIILSIIAMLVSIYNLRHKKEAYITPALDKAKQQASHTVQLLDENIYKIESVVQAIADDLSDGKLSDASIEKRIHTNLRENPSLIEVTIAYEPYAHDKNTQLYAFTIVNNQGKFKKNYIGDVYDYTKPASPGAPLTNWYINAVIEQGGIWTNAELEPYTDKPAISYSVPFFDTASKKIRGVVSISYNLEAIQSIIDDIKIGETGYGFAMSRNGTFIAFPTYSYIYNQESFISLAQEKANEKLMRIAERTLTAKEDFHDVFLDTKTNQSYVVYITQTSKAGWSIAVIFASDEVSLPPLDIRHSYFYIIIATLFGFLCLAGIACNLEHTNLSVIRKFCIVVALILFAALLATWKVILNTNTSYNPQKDGTIIVDQSRLNKFLNDVKENVKHSQSDEPQPLFMPTGVHIFSFNLPKIQHVALSGNVWQKIDLSLFKDIPKEIQLPQDISLSFKELTKSVENNLEVRVSTFDTTIFNEQNFSEFPFDTINVRLDLSSQDLARNIILVPDLVAYDSINPLDKPGIDKDFTLPGFDIQKTFFSLKKLIPTNDFGLQSFRSITEHYALIYNIVITRKLLNSFIIYILPLIVILIALFATLCSMRETEKYDPFRPLSAYASLFFGLILLHRTIREQYGVVSTLYIEYAFFYTYITMLLLVIHAVIVYSPDSNKILDKIITPLAVYFYWPIQLALWLTTTLYLFY